MKSLLFLLCLFTLPTLAQRSDSIRVEYSTEIAKPDSAPDPVHSRRVGALYHRFIRAQVQEATLIKVSGFPYWSSFNGNASWGFDSQVSVEQKVIPNLSIHGAILTRFQNNSTLSNEATIRASFGVRWYYALNKQIQQGKRANNFSSPYISIDFMTPLWKRIAERPYQYREGVALTHPGLLLTCGLQQRIGRYGFMDIGIGVLQSLRPEKGTFLAPRFAIGFGL